MLAILWESSAGQGKEVAMLTRLQFKRHGNTLEHVGGGVDVPRLFQPGVPFGAHAGRAGHFLTAEARGTPPPSARKAQILRLSQHAPALQEIGKLTPSLFTRH